ncbi:MAG: hypothetical protein JKY81_04665 [Colwellia sp.]|nr:hypothetical protein [Colwellia sp.]
MKLDKYGRFVDIWDWLLNLLLPVKDIDLLVDRLPNGSWDITLIRNGKKGKATGFGYNDTHARALKDLEAKENAS